MKGATDLLVKLGQVLHPVPGDEIMGFVTKGSGVSVHRTNCANADSLRSESERLVSVSWAPTAKTSSWSPSRSRPWTATGCSPTSPGRCRTST